MCDDLVRILATVQDQVIRLDAPESANPIDLDDYESACAELPSMARSLVEASYHKIAEMFLREPAESFVPAVVGFRS